MRITFAVMAAVLTACTGKSPQNPGAQSPERQSDAEMDLAADFLKKGNQRTALDHAQKAVSLNDENEKAHYLVAAILIGLGIQYLVRHRHPRWVRMRVGFRDLVMWSFLMASAHGAGLMVLPVLLGSSTVQAADHMPGHNHATSPLDGLVATGVHTIGYLATTGLIAWVVYRKYGLALLRTAWFNLDVVWAAALLITGLVTLVT